MGGFTGDVRLLLFELLLGVLGDDGAVLGGDGEEFCRGLEDWSCCSVLFVGVSCDVWDTLVGVMGGGRLAGTGL